jgi:hypothetical protein
VTPTTPSAEPAKGGCNGEALDRPAPHGRAQVHRGHPAALDKRCVIAEYDYRDESGALLYQTVRYDPKDFRQRRPDGRGGWLYNLSGVRRVPYRLPDLLAQPGACAFVVEGEKDADALARLSVPATTCPMGAGKWELLDRAAVERAFASRRVVILPDNDEPGRKHAREVAATLDPIALTVKIVELPGLPPKGDVSDWLAVPGNDLDVLLRLTDAAPVLPPVAGVRDGWPEPAPLGDEPGVPVFPLDVLPGPVRRFVTEGADALPCPPDYVAVPLLVLAGGAVGASRALAVKEGHVQRAALYAAVVGPPGSAKSPALDLAAAPALDTDGRLLDAWRERLAAYEDELPECESDAKPPRPVLERVTVNDATAEALVPILTENPRGVVLVRDELAGWVLSMNAYREGGKGADVQFWLSAWSGAAVTVDRKGTHAAGPLRVRHPFIGVVGCLPPDRLPALRGDRGRKRAEQDGFIDRVLFAYPPEPPAVAEDWRSVSAAARDAWRDVYDRLRTLARVPDGDGQRPFLLKLTDCGRREWQHFTAAHAAELNAPEFPDHLRGPWAKQKGYSARLALILHCLRWAAAEIHGDTADVDGESVRRAVELVNYFKAHARRVYAAMDADPAVKLARRLLRWLARQGGATFTRRDAYRRCAATPASPTTWTRCWCCWSGWATSARPAGRSAAAPAGRRAKSSTSTPTGVDRLDTMDGTPMPMTDRANCGHCVHFVHGRAVTPTVTATLPTCKELRRRVPVRVVAELDQRRAGHRSNSATRRRLTPAPRHAMIDKPRTSPHAMPQPAMTPEQKARERIDQQLRQCGWAVMNYKDLDLTAEPGVVAREFPLEGGSADYLLYADCKAVGIVEAKPRGAHPHWRRDPVRDLPGRPAGRPAALPPAAAVRLRVHRHGDPVHQRPRPGRPQPRGVRLPPARRTGPAGENDPHRKYGSIQTVTAAPEAERSRRLLTSLPTCVPLT